jgi:cytochrome b subunit of formate dehydrogenase
MNELREITVETQLPSGEHPRFRLMARIEHMVLLITFIVVCLTGLPQKFPFSSISTGLIDLLGGIETVRYIHRWAAVILVLGSVYHLLTSSYRLFVRRERMRMLPDIKEPTTCATPSPITSACKITRRGCASSTSRKVRILAVVWGTAVMIVTGFHLVERSTPRLIPGS